MRPTFCYSAKSRQKRRKLSTQFNHERNRFFNLSITSLKGLGRTFSKKLGGFNKQVQTALFYVRTSKTQPFGCVLQFIRDLTT